MKSKQPTAKKSSTVPKSSIRQHDIKKRHLKSYWPYIPISLVIGLGLFIGNQNPTTKNGVLAYATEMNISTLLSSTNQQRVDHRQPELTLNDSLTRAAQAKANDMATRNYWSHSTPEGDEPWTFVSDAGYEYSKAGENLAYGFNSSQETVSGWMSSPSHKKNLLDASYIDVGFGFANAKDFSGSGPETVVVALYGQPASSTVTGATTSYVNGAATTLATGSIDETPALGIARIQTLTKGQLPWITLAVGTIAGIIAAVTVLRHGLAFKRLVAEGESFVIHHPWADIALVAIVMTGYVLTQTSGVIR